MSYELFSTTQRVAFAQGAVNNLVSEIKRLGASKPCIITDPGLMSTGLVEKVQNILKDGGLESCLYGKVQADPPYELVDQTVELVKSEGADCVIGIGGGSSLDMAKVTSVMVKNPGSVSDYFGIDLIKNKGLPLILIPTTAGTGSEVTPIVILSDEGEKLKKGVVSPYLYPDCALLDPELTIGLPPAVTTATGMDALIHAVEAYTSKNATPMSDILAKEAMQLIFGNLRSAYADGTNAEARGNMLRGSMLAGMAFANAGVTAVHAFAYPIGAEFHIPHGIANTIMLVPVMRFNMLGNLERFADLAEIFGQPTEGLSTRQAALKAVDSLAELAEDLKVPQHLKDYGVKEANVPELAEGVLKVTRLLANNPRKLELADAEAIYRAAL
ncbi:iron-containing alcohol dehydrogenase [Maridesulfovibrio bastinii]|uniref:iron-containing alcohol dehydrogenase n=1 Tax=Maridesulfovibrio bastinii TaxID=47157 RepID=UPI000409EE65|nr:iron-containing alcohol dehydrogenase [Maridesulfovibrio bastinii]